MVSKSRSIRDPLLERGFALADRHSVDVDGLAVSGSLGEHGPYLHALSTSVVHPFQVELFVEAIEPGAVVLDCGAHIGVLTLLAARRAGPDGTVIAVEPAPPNAAALRENVRANGFGERVEFVEAAAATEAGSTPLALSLDLDRSGTVPRPERSEGAIDVPTVLLDDLLANRRLDVAKIDTEGAEALAIAGLDQTIGRSPGLVVFLECHARRLAEGGTDPAAWLAGLRERGALELIDEEERRVLTADDETIAWAVRERELSFNLRWTLA